MFLNVCSDPDVLLVMNIVNNILYILKLLVPVIILITAIISFAKAVMHESDKEIKNAAQLFLVKLFVGAFVFFIPTVVGSIISIVDPKSEYMDCFNKASKENIQKAYLSIANSLVSAVEKSVDADDYEDAVFAVSRLKDGASKNNLEKRLKVVKASIDKNRAEKIEQIEEEINDAIAANKKLNVTGSYSTDGNGTAQPGVYQNSEPDPSAAVNYWTSVLNPDNFIYPTDSKTGLPLGAWPKNYADFKTQLSSYKTYSGGFIWPCTPVNSNYHFVYNHNGMDIMAVFGTPIYSPVDGILEYSEWGHTSNRGGDETAYTVSIKLSTPITAQGKSITNVFLTHMSGIRYRCARGACNHTVKKGELLGFVGNAAGDSSSVGWAPHLHMTFYSGSYDNGLYTPSMESLYNIPNGTSSYNIVAGG